MNHQQRSSVWMDAVADFYSKRQTGGSLRVGSRRSDRYGSYGIPLYGKSKQGVTEAVNAAAGGVIKKFVRDKPKKDGKKRLSAGSKKFRQRFTDDGVASMSESDDDTPPPPKHKRKRSRIDDVLGDD